jgi:predicted DNA-binding transcriptional regulator AlpA
MTSHVTVWSQIMSHQLPETGYLRVTQIVGDPKADPPILGIIPVGKSTWWEGVRSGRFPKPIKLGPRTTAWRVEDVRALVEKINSNDLWSA